MGLLKRSLYKVPAAAPQAPVIESGHGCGPEGGTLRDEIRKTWKVREGELFSGKPRGKISIGHPCPSPQVSHNYFDFTPAISHYCHLLLHAPYDRAGQ